MATTTSTRLNEIIEELAPSAPYQLRCELTAYKEQLLQQETAMAKPFFQLLSRSEKAKCILQLQRAFPDFPLGLKEWKDLVYWLYNECQKEW